MQRIGHLGVAVLCYAPVAAGLAAADQSTLALVGAAVTVSLASLPDCDLLIPGVSHRGSTHTVAFAVVIGLVFGAAGWVIRGTAGPESPLVFGVLTGGAATLAVVSHLLADWMTPMGVRPFWPLSSRSYTLALVPADNWFWNRALLSLGGLAAGVVAYATG